MEINKFLLVFMLLLIFVSCKKEIKITKNYNIFNEDNVIKGFLQNKITINETKRVDTVIRFSKKGINLDTVIKKYIISKSGLKNLTNNSNYIFIKTKDSCYNYEDVSKKLYDVCYLGKHELTLNKKRINNLYKFKVTHLADDGVSKYLFFDENFILIKNEYKSGYAPYFNIEVTD
jgi:hypothetical protein